MPGKDDTTEGAYAAEGGVTDTSGDAAAGFDTPEGTIAPKAPTPTRPPKGAEMAGSAVPKPKRPGAEPAGGPKAGAGTVSGGGRSGRRFKAVFRRSDM